jgi:hypothetical protein
MHAKYEQKSNGGEKMSEPPQKLYPHGLPGAPQRLVGWGAGAGAGFLESSTLLQGPCGRFQTENRGSMENTAQSFTAGALYSAAQATLADETLQESPEIGSKNVCARRTLIRLTGSKDDAKNVWTRPLRPISITRPVAMDWQ